VQARNADRGVGLVERAVSRDAQIEFLVPSAVVPSSPVRV